MYVILSAVSRLGCPSVASITTALIGFLFVGAPPADGWSAGVRWLVNHVWWKAYDLLPDGIPQLLVRLWVSRMNTVPEVLQKED